MHWYYLGPVNLDPCSRYQSVVYIFCLWGIPMRDPKYEDVIIAVVADLFYHQGFEGNTSAARLNKEP